MLAGTASAMSASSPVDLGGDIRKLHPYAGAAFARPKSARDRLAAFVLPAAFIAAFCVAVTLGLVLSPAQKSRAATAVGAAAHEAPRPAETVAAWAEAWSAQRVGDYLGLYSPQFQPPPGTSRAEWAAQRASRISAPRFIKLEIEELQAAVLEPGRVRVSFIQLYESDRYRDATRKIVDLRLEDGQWKIVHEEGEPVHRTPPSA